MTTFGVILTNLSVLLPHTYAHTTSRILPNCDSSLRSLTLPALKLRDFVELILLYQRKRCHKPDQYIIYCDLCYTYVLCVCVCVFITDLVCRLFLALAPYSTNICLCIMHVYFITA